MDNFIANGNSFFQNTHLGIHKADGSVHMPYSAPETGQKKITSGNVSMALRLAFNQMSSIVKYSSILTPYLPRQPGAIDDKANWLGCFFSPLTMAT
jgi:hypothetical protein